MATSFSTVGRSVVRGEGPDKVSGRSIYGVDVTRPGMLWGKILRSPFPHANIVSIDVSTARRLAGIHTILTGDDLPTSRVGRYLRDIPVLAQGRVRFVGEKVAAVAAESPEVAEEALLLIDVEYEELPSVFDPMEALEPGAPILHPELATYEGLPGPIDGPTNDFCANYWPKGDLERGFAESDMIFEHTFTTQLMHQGYLEPHACLVEVDGSGRAQVWANNKAPFALRTQLAEVTGLGESEILINPCSIGGDFGGKGDFMDVPLCYHLARASGKPVKMSMSYIEELMAGNPRHPSLITIKSGVKKDGTLWARHVKAIFNGGAYGAFTPRVYLPGARHGAGCYRIPNALVESHMVYTNTVPGGHMRGPGEPQTMFATESHTDMIAREMGKDPYEFRLQNVLRDGDSDPTGEYLSEVRAEDAVRRAAEAARWQEPLAGKAVGRGMGLAQRPPGTGETTAFVTLDSDGRATLHTPIWDTGTGAHTILRQIVAEELTLPVEDVSLDVLNTDGVVFDSGVGGSRVTYTAGRATLGAAQDLKAKLIGLASDLLEWPEDKVVIDAGQVSLDGDPASAVSLQDLASRAVRVSGQAVKGEFHFRATPSEVTAFCAQVAEVEVDTETGQVHVRKLITAHDVGTIINPMAHQGQVEGGLVQGLGFAVMEEMQTADGRVSTLSLGDYKLPTMNDIPDLTTIHVGGPSGPAPYDGKGIGENSISGVTPAIANAIEDAVGVRITDTPITPEKVLRALREKADAGK